MVKGSDNSLDMRLLPLKRRCAVLLATETLSKLDTSVVSLLSLTVEYLFMVMNKGVGVGDWPSRSSLLAVAKRCRGR